jgi:hypothetical protein
MSSSNAATEGGWAVKFIPFASTVDSPFWVQYCHEKLENIQLNEDPISIRANFGVDEQSGPPRVQCQESSLLPRMSSSSESDAIVVPVAPNERVAVSGTLLGFNTLDSFQKIDKNTLLNDLFCPQFLKGDLDCLTSAVLLTFPDLKSHKVLYWFGFPALLTVSGMSIRATQQTLFRDTWSADERQSLGHHIQSLRKRSLEKISSNGSGLPPYFVCTKDKCEALDSEALTRLGVTADDAVFVFFDPSGPVVTPLQAEQPMGWPMRNLIAYLCFHLNLGGQTVQVLSYRPKRVRRLTADGGGGMDEDGEESGNSVLLHVSVPLKKDYEWNGGTCSSSPYKTVGWELNARNKPGPRWVNLKPLLDSNHLAIQAADLNLKLMKWYAIYAMLGT